MTTRIIWLTGFGPFPGVDDNPTQRVAEALNGRRRPGFEVRGETLPVSFERASRRIEEAYQDLRPAIGLHLGVAVNASEIRVERLAANERTASRPDVDNALPMGERCNFRYSVADRLETNVDTGIIAARIRRHGLPARVSDDAGRYVCNSSYFAALDCAQRFDPRPLALFLHLPMPGKPRSVGGMTWQLDDLVLASRVVLLALTDYLTGRITGPIA